MRSRSMSRFLLAVALGAVALVAACSGGTDRESVTLQQYFTRVQELHEEQQRGSEAIGERLAPQFGEVESVEAALEVMQAVLPQFLPEFRSLIEETRLGLDAMEPPSKVQDEHAELLGLYDHFVALVDDAADQLERGEAGIEVLQTFLGESSGTALGVRFTALANRLAAIAEANGIEVELNAGPLVADSGRSRGQGNQPSVTVAEPTAPTLTGIADVDAVFDAVTLASYYGDFTALEMLVRFTTTGCTQRDGLGGPPKCLSTTVEDAQGKRRVWTEEEGQLVEVFPFSVCEGEYARRDSDVASLLRRLAAPDGEPGLVERAYAVYDLRGEEPGPAYWPEGDYAIVFAMRQGDERWGTRVRIGSGGIVRIDFGCGPRPPDAMGIPGATNILLAASSDSPRSDSPRPIGP